MKRTVIQVAVGALIVALAVLTAVGVAGRVSRTSPAVAGADPDPSMADRAVTDPSMADRAVTDHVATYLDSYPEGRVLGVMTAHGSEDEIADFARAAGRPANMVAVTAGWAADEYSPWFTDRIAAMGAMPLISWEPWDAARESSVDQLRSEQPDYAVECILAGDFDDYIDDWGRGLADWGHPVAIRFAHEMNGYWYPWADGRNGNRGGDYVKLWRYVHDRVTAAGADQVIWVWSPNVVYANSTPYVELYPGDEYVDWAGLVGYFGHLDEAPSTQPGFDGVFGASLVELATVTDAPVLITETGAGEYGDGSAESGSLKAEWITEAVGRFATDPRLLGFVWFNVAKEEDWRVDSSPEAQAAFRASVAGGRFAPAHPDEGN